MLDLIFIDSIKKKNELIETIDAYLNHFPNIIIVGDDLQENNDVRRAIISSKYRKILYVFEPSSYIITRRKMPKKFPDAVSTYNDYNNLYFTPEEKQFIKKNMSRWISYI